MEIVGKSIIYSQLRVLPIFFFFFAQDQHFSKVHKTGNKISWP
jgi:hypothetical protein